MPINYDALMNLRMPPVEQTLDSRDIILYALGVGLGANPLDPNELRYVYEEGLQALPTMAMVLCYGTHVTGFPDTGITRTHVVHGEQGLEMDRPLPITGTLIGQARVIDVIDKGEGKGALVYTETTLTDKASGARICTLNSTTFCRADGGFGGPLESKNGPARPVHALPQRAPDATCDLPSLPQAALIYRLSGDYNPLHADPAYAKRAGFDRPILHGRCTFGVAGHALIKLGCGDDPTRLLAMQGRFSAPVYPGETIRTEVWREGSNISYRATVPARGATVISNGQARVA